MPIPAHPASQGQPSAPSLRMLGEATPPHTETVYHEEDFAWIRWLFQSARIRHGSLIFSSQAKQRSQLLSDWETFAHQVWLPFIAPAMLQSWQAALENRDQSFPHIANTLNQTLPSPLLKNSIEAGRWLLATTEGAKYQGPLGRLRQQASTQLIEPHLPIVWAATAALFQLPAPELLIAILREEWRSGCPEHLPHSEPKGSCSFGTLAKIALRTSFKPRHAAG